MFLDSMTQTDRYSKWFSMLTDGFKFLKEQAKPSLADGKHEIDGSRIFAVVSSYDTRAADSFEPEAHKRYLDIQYLISGRETILWTPLDEAAEISIPYSDEKDIMFFKRNQRARPFELAAGHFCVFFPQDVHQPGAHADHNTPSPVKKVIVKVAL